MQLRHDVPTSTVLLVRSSCHWLTPEQYTLTQQQAGYAQTHAGCDTMPNGVTVSDNIATSGPLPQVKLTCMSRRKPVYASVCGA